MDETYASELRIAMFGKRFEDMITLTDFLFEQKASKPNSKVNLTALLQQCVHGSWNDRKLTIYKIKNKDSAKIEPEIRQCVASCSPGPNVLLLLIDPSNFSESDSEKLQHTLSCFDKNAFEYAIVVTTKQSCSNEFAEEIKRKCNNRHHRIVLVDEACPGEEILEFMQKVQNLVNQNDGKHLSLKETSESGQEGRHEAQLKDKQQTQEKTDTLHFSPHSTVDDITPKNSSYTRNKSKSLLAPTNQLNLPLTKNRSQSVMSPWNGSNYRAENLNIVLCGRFEELKMIASHHILKHVDQGKVSVVDLPALSDMHPNDAKIEANRSVLACSPEGVHAFALVLPVGPGSLNDKQEVEALLKFYGAHVKAFTMILFVVDSEPAAAQVEIYAKYYTQITTLCRICEGRSFTLNINESERVPELLRMVRCMSQRPFEMSNYSLYSQRQSLRITEEQTNQWWTETNVGVEVTLNPPEHAAPPAKLDLSEVTIKIDEMRKEMKLWEERTEKWWTERHEKEERLRSEEWERQRTYVEEQLRIEKEWREKLISQINAMNGENKSEFTRHVNELHESYTEVVKEAVNTIDVTFPEELNKWRLLYVLKDKKYRMNFDLLTEKHKNEMTTLYKTCKGDEAEFLSQKHTLLNTHKKETKMWLRDREPRAVKLKSCIMIFYLQLHLLLQLRRQPSQTSNCTCSSSQGPDRVKPPTAPAPPAKTPNKPNLQLHLLLQLRN
ncbi:hypothetical protein WMY93_004244 [Mugilogobius chulae]|uniref:AIG1-type G domain-containing protein n=1 Tax=Mugilogobius chulae TaxID=88201 RepID=A0AAW0PRS1_9GOBI